MRVVDAADGEACCGKSGASDRVLKGRSDADLVDEELDARNVERAGFIRVNEGMAPCHCSLAEPVKYIQKSQGGA